MAKPAIPRFGKVFIRLGNGADPEVFSAPCGLTSKGLTFTSAMGEVNIPDCDDPDAVSWLGRDKQSLSAAISGEGVLPATAVQDYWEFLTSQESRNVEVEIEYSTGSMLWAGAFHLETFNPSVEQGGRVTAQLSLQSDGEVTGTWIPAT